MAWRARFKGIRAILFTSVSRMEKGAWAMGLALLAIVIIGSRFLPDGVLPAEGLRRVATWLGDLSTAAQLGLVALAAAAFAVRVLLGRNPAERIVSAVAQKRIARFARRAEDVLSEKAPPVRLRWVDGAADVERISRLNAEAFSESFTYSGGFDSKLRRNGPLLARVPQAFAFIEDDGHQIGFSSIIPLTSNFADQYRRGLISDHNLVPEMLPAKGERCGGVVLFAIALVPRLERARGRMTNLRYIRQLVAGHAEHLGEMLKRYGDRSTPIIVQAEKASILRALKSAGFNVSGQKGGDGDLLLTSSLSSLQYRIAAAATAS